MSVDINDFKTVPAKLTFKAGIFRKLQSITFFLEDAVYAVITIDESVDSKATEFNLAIVKSPSVKLIKKDKQGLEFAIWENDKKWEPVTNTALLNYAPFKSYKSESSEIKLRDTGYGCMFYKDDNFIGRIRSGRKLFSLHPTYFVDVLDMASLNFLLAICTVIILQKHFLKLGSPGE